MATLAVPAVWSPALSARRIDLHTHSSASDGTSSPADLVREAKAAGLDVVALTDHDTTAGWSEAGIVGGVRAWTLGPGR